MYLEIKFLNVELFEMLILFFFSFHYSFIFEGEIC